jgi:hypothetical protein
LISTQPSHPSLVAHNKADETGQREGIHRAS